MGKMSAVLLQSPSTVLILHKPIPDPLFRSLRTSSCNGRKWVYYSRMKFTVLYVSSGFFRLEFVQISFQYLCTKFKTRKNFYSWVIINKGMIDKVSGSSREGEYGMLDSFLVGYQVLVVIGKTEQMLRSL